MKPFYISVCLLFSSFLYGQIDTIYTQKYLERSTSFAWLTYGGDINYMTGGSTQILNNGTKETIDFGSTLMPRLTIGGIHFWGYADFYVTFPLAFLTLQDKPNGIDQFENYQGVETGMRLYPIPLKEKRISPFAGISFRGVRFSQESESSLGENGVPTYGTYIYPIQFGLTYTSKKWHLTGSGYYNYQNNFDYYITPTEQAAVALNPLSFNLSILRYIDSDRYVRTERATRQINKDYQTLKDQKLLSAWFFGIGPSAALQINKSPYLRENFPYFYEDNSVAILPDLTFGRYFHPIDANVNLAFRSYRDGYSGFDSEIKTRRTSFGVESVKFLFNYLGFVPFAGPILSYESLQTTVNGKNYNDNKLALGLNFGWDIRVTRTGTSLLRTNLRYYPNLHMNIEGEKMMFNHLEFNFIQWVQFIGRKKVLRR